MITADEAFLKVWGQPLELVERDFDETFDSAIETVVWAIARGEVGARAAVKMAFASGAYYAATNRPADPPTGGASGS